MPFKNVRIKFKNATFFFFNVYSVLPAGQKRVSDLIIEMVMSQHVVTRN